MNSTDLIQENETTDKYCQRDPELDIGGDGSKQVAGNAVHRIRQYRTPLKSIAEFALRHLRGAEGGSQRGRRIGRGWVRRSRFWTEAGDTESNCPEGGDGKCTFGTSPSRALAVTLPHAGFCQ